MEDIVTKALEIREQVVDEYPLSRYLDYFSHPAYKPIGHRMKMLKSKTWRHEITGTDENVILFGVNIFDYEWKDTHKSVKVRHPLYDQEYKFPIYTVVISGQEQEFAAGEFSNCVWGFYLLKY